MRHTNRGVVARERAAGGREGRDDNDETASSVKHANTTRMQKKTTTANEGLRHLFSRRREGPNTPVGGGVSRREGRGVVVFRSALYLLHAGGRVPGGLARDVVVPVGAALAVGVGGPALGGVGARARATAGLRGFGGRGRLGRRGVLGVLPGGQGGVGVGAAVGVGGDGGVGGVVGVLGVRRGVVGVLGGDEHLLGLERARIGRGGGEALLGLSSLRLALLLRQRG
mmetsp:Transcript_23346/g.71819  ORF Transcript_23346/g.71819 Transcript_23346/m.71819 type:complete len:226 (-) Transcript_23346:787-1464(-)